MRAEACLNPSAAMRSAIVLSFGGVAWLVQTVAQGSLFRLADLSTPSFAGFGPNAAQVAYVQSYAFIDYLVRTYGERRLRDFVRELLRTGVLDRAVSKTFRSSLDDLEGAFGAELAARR